MRQVGLVAMNALQVYTDTRTDDSSSESDGDDACSALPRLPDDFNTPAPTAGPCKDQFRVLVFLPLPDPAVAPAFGAFLNRLSARARLLLVGAAHKPALHGLPHGLHVSLSRAGSLHSGQIKPLLSGLREATSGVGCGSLTLTDSLVALPGQVGERCYVGATVEKECEPQITALVRQVDAALASVGMPPFFEEPNYHMSFAWTDGMEVQRLLTRSGTRYDVSATYKSSYQSILCTIGCRTHRITLTKQ